MFVIPRSTQTTQTSDTRTTSLQSRSAAQARQRGSSPIQFPAIAEEASGRVSESSSARSVSPKTVTPSATAGNLPVQVQPGTAQKSAVLGVGMQKLIDALNTLGMANPGLTLNYREEVVRYPGGSYTNRLIEATSGGKTQMFSGDLTEQSPFVTAYEIQRYLNVVPSNSGNGSTRLG